MSDDFHESWGKPIPRLYRPFDNYQAEYMQAWEERFKQLPQTEQDQLTAELAELYEAAGKHRFTYPEEPTGEELARLQDLFARSPHMFLGLIADPDA